jgi:hypothetical protein
MKAGRLLGWVGGLFGSMLLVAACGIDQHRPFFHGDDDETPEFSAARLGDPFDADSVTDFLAPEEREAVMRSGMTGLRLHDANDSGAARPEPEPKSRIGRALDTAGKVGVSLLGVGVTLGAAAAPFLMFQRAVSARVRALGVAAAIAALLYLMLDSGAVTPDQAPRLVSLPLGGLACLFGVGAWAMTAGGQPAKSPLLAGLALGTGGYALFRLLAF